MNNDTVLHHTLERILSNNGYAAVPVRAFAEWPSLEQIALQYINFISPWMVVRGKNLAESTISEALAAFERDLSQPKENRFRSFIEAIAASAKTLAEIRVSVKDTDDLWSIWTYDEPLMSYLAFHKRQTIQIREREMPAASGPVMIKMLAAIGSTRELEAASLDLPRLLLMNPSS